MIDVEIRGPIAKKEYLKVKKLLETAGAKVRTEKGTLTALYGGAEFSLFDPGEDFFWYEAGMSVKGPAEAAEAQKKLEKLARTLKLPIWSPLAMLSFMERLKEVTDWSR